MNDDELFDQFCCTWFERLLKFARKFGDRDDAADAVKDCLLKFRGQILNHLRQKGESLPSNFPTFLWWIIKCNVIDLRRHWLQIGEEKVPRVLPTDPNEMPSLPTTDAAPTKDTVDAWRAVLKAAFVNCTTLTKNERQVIELISLIQRKDPTLSDTDAYSGASAELGWSYSKVKMTYWRGLRKIETHLKAHGIQRLSDI